MTDKLDIKLRYTCAAYPPIGINADTTYKFGKNEKGFFYSSSDNTYYADLWFIKMLFTPINKKWEDVERLFK